MKRYDYIKGLTRWELAEFLYDVSNSERAISNCDKPCAECENSESWCISEIAEFLNEDI